jgi:hypothetical protein
VHEEILAVAGFIVPLVVNTNVAVAVAAVGNDDAVNAAQRAYTQLTQGQYDLAYRRGRQEDVSDDKAHSGQDVRAKLTAVTYEVEVSLGSESETSTTTSHVVKVGKRWKWVMKADKVKDIQDYANTGEPCTS